ncbi:MAG: hypothetical protein IPL26_02405 [Leptospiraceae bacterium]|nr:hypothetical protein [Leptospiraceae bacterium]
MAKTVVEELIYEYWDCDKCGQKAIRGDIRNCPSCGNARNENIHFYRINDQEEIVEDKTQADKFKAGADWLCSFCETLNSVTDNTCLSCGATQESSKKNYFELQKEKDLKAAKNIQSTKPIEESKKSVNWKKISIWAIAILGSCITSLYFLGKTHNVSFQVVGVAWERTIPINRYSTVEQTDWDDELKGDNIVKLNSSQEIRSYEDRQIGTKTESYTETEEYRSGSKRECNTSYESTGSGASKKVTSCDDVPTYSSRTVHKTREVPVYKKFPIYGTKVLYKANKYIPLREDYLAGRDNQPIWPDVKIGVGVAGKTDLKGEPKSSYIVELRKVNPEEKAKEFQKIKTTEAKFINFYILNESVIKEVNVFDEIVLEEGEERVEDNEKQK